MSLDGGSTFDRDVVKNIIAYHKYGALDPVRQVKDFKRHMKFGRTKMVVCSVCNWAYSEREIKTNHIH